MSRRTEKLVFGVALGWMLLIAPAVAAAQDVDELEPVPFTGPIEINPIAEPRVKSTRVTPAAAQVRIDNAGLRFGEVGDGERGWHFFVRSRCVIWVGLDANREPIHFSQGQSMQPRSFSRLQDQPIHASARLRMARSDQILATQNFIYNGTDTYDLSFPIIPRNQRILPGMYEIEITVYLNRQPRQTQEIIWQEQASIVQEGNPDRDGLIEFERINVRQAHGVTNHALIGVAGRDFGGTYVSMPVGGIEHRRQALESVQRYDALHQRIRESERRIDDMTPVELMNLQLQRTRLGQLEHLRERAADFEHDIRDLERYEAMVQQAMSAYAEAQADEIEALVINIWKVSREVYWMAHLCRPDFHIRSGASGPNPKDPNERIQYDLAEMREMFNVGNGSFLDAPFDAHRDPRNPDDDPITGRWRGDEWVAWLTNDWMPQIEELREQYNRLFSDPREGIDWGIRPDGQPTYFAPLWGDHLERLSAAIDNLGPTGRGHANSLTRIHLPEGEQERLPFVDTRRRRPSADPAPGRETTYYQAINNALNRAIIEFDIRLAPEVEDEEEYRAERRRRDSRSDSARAPWAEMDIDPGRYSEFYRRDSDNKVITRRTYDELSEEEREQFRPYDPTTEAESH